MPKKLRPGKSSDKPINDSHEISLALSQRGPDFSDKHFEATGLHIIQDCAAVSDIFHGLVLQSPISTWIADRNGTAIFINDACRKLLDIQKDDSFIGKYNILKDKVLRRQGLMPIVKQVFEKGVASEITVEYDLSKSGLVDISHSKTLHIRGHLFPIKDNDDNIIFVVVQIEDYSEKFSSDSALCESEERFRVLAGASFEGIVIHDKGVVLEVNDAFLQMTGYDRSDLIGKYSLNILTEESQDAVLNRVAIGSEEPYEITIKRKDGTLFTAEIRGKNINYKGTLARVTAARDVTERKRAEEAVKTSEANYRAILDTANDAIFVHDVDTGQILEVNKTMCEMYGYTAEEAKCLSVGDLSAEEPPYTKKDAQKWLNKAKAGDPQLFEWKAKHKSGQFFWVEVNLKVATIGGQKRILAVVRDISERKQSEEAKQRMEAHYKEQQKQFYKHTIQAVTGGKLMVIEPEEVISFDGEIVESCELQKPEDIAQARYGVKCLAECLGMSEMRSENLALCAGEAATNALKHAGGGCLYLMTRERKIVIKVSDNGPGMDALILPRATLELGYSTVRSLGMGYAVILALSDQTYLCTGPAGTTVIMETNLDVTVDKDPVDSLPDTW